MNDISYVVGLLDSTGSVLERVRVGSDSCENMVCFATLFLSSSDLDYRINVAASNFWGSSAPTFFAGTICKFQQNQLHNVWLIYEYHFIAWQQT